MRRGTTVSLGEVMRQVVEENVQPCSEQPSQIQTQLASEPISPTPSPPKDPKRSNPVAGAESEFSDPAHSRTQATVTT